METVLNKMKSFVFTVLPKMHERLLIHYFKDECNLCNMNKNQYKTLMILKNSGEKSMTDLGKILHLEKGSLTTIIDTLTEDGYVVRSQDKKDRRKYVIKLTEKGVQFTQIQMSKFGIFLEGKLEKLSLEDKEKLLEAITIIEDITNKL